MNCHQDETNGFFLAHSTFIPQYTETRCVLDDPEPELVKQAKKQAQGIIYLPGEKLLIKLHKQRQKERSKKEVPDIERITKSLSRVLSTF
jgi:hypothetical protein